MRTLARKQRNSWAAPPLCRGVQNLRRTEIVNERALARRRSAVSSHAGTRAESSKTPHRNDALQTRKGLDYELMDIKKRTKKSIIVRQIGQN